MLALLLACTVEIGDVRTPDSGSGDTAESDNAITRPDDYVPPEDTEPTGDPIDEACYLGPARDHAACFPVVRPAAMPAGYDYPAPLNGSAQYRAPVAFLDLSTLSEDEPLAPNFALSELAQSWKGRYAVVQTHAVDTLQALRDELGPLVVNSGYRSVDYNASVGGATWSRHMYGDAFDLDAVNHDLDTLADTCEARGADYIGWYEAHIHCDWRDTPVDPVFYGESGREAVAAPRPALDGRLERVGSVWTAPASGWDEGEPLREWTALDARGTPIAAGRGASFTPPPGTTEVRVLIGRAVERRTPVR